MIDKFKKWMHWRGITVKDLAVTIGSLGFLLGVLIVFTRGACLAL